MPRLRKTLPRDFEEQLKTKSVDEIRAVLEGCELDARGGYRKSTALAFRDLPDELVRWLVERGLASTPPTSTTSARWWHGATATRTPRS